MSRRTAPVATGAIWLATLSVTVLGILRALRHELSIDEAQAWAIAVDSSNPIEVFSNVRLEGHPALWHLILWVGTIFTTNAIGLKLISVALSGAAIGIIFRFAPFPFWVRAVVAFSYFPFFEYQIVARTYSLSLLAVVGFCAIASSRRSPRWEALAMVTVAGVWASALTAVIFGLLWLWLLAEYWREQLLTTKHGNSQPENSQPESTEPGFFDSASRRSMVRGTALVLLGAIAAGVQVLFPITSYAGEVSSGANAANQAGPAVLFKAAVPTVPFRFEAAYDWLLGPGIAVFGLLTVAIYLGVAVATGRRSTAILWLVGTPVVMAIVGFIGLLSVHDDGHLFLLGLAAIWLGRAHPSDAGWLRSPRLKQVGESLVIGTTAISAVMALWFSATDWNQPYSPSAAAASALREGGYAEATLLTDRPERTVGILVDLDRDAWLISLGRSGRRADQDQPRYPAITEVLDAARNRSIPGTPTIIIAAESYDNDQLIELAAFDESFLSDTPADRVRLYLYQP